MTPGTKISVLVRHVTSGATFGSSITRFSLRRGNAIKVHGTLLHYRYADDRARRATGIIPMWMRGSEWCHGWDVPEADALLAAAAL